MAAAPRRDGKGARGRCGSSFRTFPLPSAAARADGPGAKQKHEPLDIKSTIFIDVDIYEISYI
jgi:hypothetical protein